MDRNKVEELYNLAVTYAGKEKGSDATNLDVAEKFAELLLEDYHNSLEKEANELRDKVWGEYSRRLVEACKKQKEIEEKERNEILDTYAKRIMEQWSQSKDDLNEESIKDVSTNN